MWCVNSPLICYYSRKKKNLFVKRNRWKNGQEPCDVPYASNWSRQEMWAGVMLGHWFQWCCCHMKWGWRWSAGLRKQIVSACVFLNIHDFPLCGCMWVHNVFSFEMNTMLGDELLRIKLVSCLNVVCSDLIKIHWKLALYSHKYLGENGFCASPEYVLYIVFVFIEAL